LERGKRQLKKEEYKNLYSFFCQESSLKEKHTIIVNPAGFSILIDYRVVK
jgi:hypothetical protein